MTWNARIFFVGAGTTFAILALGFGGGILLANSAMKDSGSVVRPSTRAAAPVARVVYPPPSQEPVEQVAAAVPEPQPPQVQPADVKVLEQPQPQLEEHQKTRRELLRTERRRQRAERRAERRAPRNHWEVQRQQEPAMMAFGN